MTKGGRKPRVSDDDILELFRETNDPVLSTAEVADALPIGRRGVLNRLHSLEDEKKLMSKNIGGRNIVWWLVEDPIAASRLPDERERTPESEPEPATKRNRPDIPALEDVNRAVWGVVDDVSSSWADDERLSTRRNAAAVALQYALNTEGYIGKSDRGIQSIREEYHVPGQDDETWWRKNVRDVLKAVGEYSRGHYGYRVDELDDE